jgi:hypothetical protein
MDKRGRTSYLIPDVIVWKLTFSINLEEIVLTASGQNF